MRDLYARLKDKGFDRAFIRDAVLPEWWEDELAAVPANRALAETYIARGLGFQLAELHDPQTELSLRLPSKPSFKRYKNQVDDRVLATALIAQRAAGLLADLLEALPAYRGELDAGTARRAILSRHRFVNLRSLIELCWENGIIVFRLRRVPRAGKTFDGMAAFYGQRPVIVLGSIREAPAWIAFHLAHELAHILLGHVFPGSPPLTDSSLENTRVTNDSQEQQADRAACEILTGFEQPTIPLRKWNAEQLARQAEMAGPAQGVDPGVFALIYAKSNDRWPAGQGALKRLGEDQGAANLVAEPLQSRLEGLDATEPTSRFLGAVTGVTI
ncbi:MAG: ImmA/IrrE family metallo-endopeptidase [Thermoanaerobaculia bacterium]|nr:ImmA/IrrE family metallo-endopeptidase [Thermoanaerobaculia bacterium]